MLRHLVLSATMLCGLNTLKSHGEHRLSRHQDLADAAAELERRAEAVDPELAQAAEALALRVDDDAFQRVAALMPRVPEQEHALQTLWRAIEQRHAELADADLYAAGDEVE